MAITANTDGLYDFERTGHGIKVTFSEVSGGTLTVFCKEVTDPGFNIPDTIDLSHNETEGYKAQAPGDLAEIPNVTLTCMYNMADAAIAESMVGVYQTITFVHTKSGQAKVMRGWLNGFVPQGQSTNNAGEAQIEIGFPGDFYGDSGGNSSSAPFGEVTATASL